jgi:hypothetical protein
MIEESSLGGEVSVDRKNKLIEDLRSSILLDKKMFMSMAAENEVAEVVVKELIKTNGDELVFEALYEILKEVVGEGQQEMQNFFDSCRYKVLSRLAQENNKLSGVSVKIDPKTEVSSEVSNKLENLTERFDSSWTESEKENWFNDVKKFYTEMLLREDGSPSVRKYMDNLAMWVIMGVARVNPGKLDEYRLNFERIEKEAASDLVKMYNFNKSKGVKK